MTLRVSTDRASSALWGRRLEYFTIAWNLLEALIALLAGANAGSISLVGFGIDSLIEVASGSAVLWRMLIDSDSNRREPSEKRVLTLVGICFLALAAYVGYESATALLRARFSEKSIPGIILACASVVVMPLLSRAKRRVASQLGSAAMYGDAKQADFCAYLSGILLIGLIANVLLGWWWADPLAALLMVPIIAKEGIDSLRGKPCPDCVHTASSS